MVSNIQLQDRGSGYRKADYLGVADESLVRSGGSTSTMRLTLYVDHVGFAAGAGQLVVDDAAKFAINDLIKVGDEILEIQSIVDSGLNVLTARQGTAAIDHFDGCLLYTSPSPRDRQKSRMPSSA